MSSFRKSLVTFGVPFLAALLSFPVGNAFAVPITVTNLSPAWVLLTGSESSNPTWALPADLTGIGCGSENGTTCEPPGDFLVSQPFAYEGFVVLQEPPDFGANYSDIITFTNTGPGNIGEIKFFSDPDPNSTQNPPGCCVPGGLQLIESDGETASGGGAQITGLISGIGSFKVSIASDGESRPFDPFNFGFDTSDQIEFTQATTSVVPLPAALPLFASGLAGLGWLSRRRKRGNTEKELSA